MEVIDQDSRHAPDLPHGESVVLPEFYRPFRTSQIEYRFVPPTNRMSMCWSMIVWINHNPKSVKPQHRRHWTNTSNVPKRFGLRQTRVRTASSVRQSVSIPAQLG
jgi:hypothetical protein